MGGDIGIPGRRRYSFEFKRGVVAETLVPGVSVAAVARRHNMNANVIFNWRYDPRFNPELNAKSNFLPVTMEEARPQAMCVDSITPQPEPERSMRSPPGTVEVTLPCRSRVVCHGDVDASFVLEVLAGLQTQR